MKSTSKILRLEAKRRRVLVEISKGRTSDDQGAIELMAPEGYQIEENLHALITVQQIDEISGNLEPWQNVLDGAYKDLISIYIQKCPDDCSCKENN